MTTEHDDDPGFWPGFVAATAGLVLGLLIMAMVLGISLYVLGQLVSLTDKKAVHGPEARADAASQPPVVTARLPPPPVWSSDPIERPTQPLVGVEPVRPLVTLEFVGQSVQVPSSAQKELTKSVQQAMSAGVREWLIEIHTDEQDLSRQRAAFLRLMAVRNVLMSADVPASAIVTQRKNSGANPDDFDLVKVFSLPPPTAEKQKEVK
jgi:hypothetical protein